jgi:hypothetical protein
MIQSEKTTEQSDPFTDVRGKRMDQLNHEQQDRAMELWIRTHINSFPEIQLHQISALLRIVDRNRSTVANLEGPQSPAAALEPSPGAYNGQRIAWELDRTALGEAFFGNALRVAKDVPCLTAEDRAVLDRFATGTNSKTDHIKLQDIARRVRQEVDAASPVQHQAGHNASSLNEGLFQTEQTDLMRQCLEIIAVGDSDQPQQDAARALVAAGLWTPESVQPPSQNQSAPHRPT